MKPNRLQSCPELCALKEKPWEHRLDHGDWNYGFCSACYTSIIGLVLIVVDLFGQVLTKATNPAILEKSMN